MRLASRPAVALATEVHSVADATGEPLEETYGYGFQLHGDGVFGHGGSDGTAAFIDPEHELIVLVFTQSPGGRLMHDRFRKLVEASIKPKDW